MKYGLIYRITYNDMEAGVTTTCDIIDTRVLIPDADDPIITPLQPNGQPVIISVINNDRDKFSPIRAKQAVITFLSNRGQLQDTTTFSDAPDNTFRVEIYTQDETVFLGFLMLTDMEQLFQPDPVVVQLTASDHLALLKDIPFVDLSGANPEGKYRIADLLAGALALTGLSLDIKVLNNVRHGSGERTMDLAFQSGTNLIFLSASNFFYEGQTVEITGTASNNGTLHIIDAGTSIVGFAKTVEALVTEASVTATVLDVSSTKHFYDGVLISASTLEDQIGTSINAYDVLALILGEDCFLTQYKGAWYIQRVDELDGNLRYIANFTAAGAFVDIDAGVDINVSIGAAEDMVLANADAIQASNRPHKRIVNTFNYDTPLELICNVDFERGDLTTTISNAEKHYTLDCWQQFLQDAGGLSQPTADIYVRRDFVNDQETARYVVITSDTDASNLVLSKPVDMLIKDKFIITAYRRMATDQGPSGQFTDILAQVRLYGNDGTFYTLHGGVTTDAIPRWVACTADFNSNQKTIQYQGDGDEDQTDTVSKTVEAPPLPVSGYIRVLLFQSSIWGDTTDTYLEPPRLEYLPFINGSYGKYTAQSNEIVRDGNDFNAARLVDVRLSDSPRPSLKGSMFIPMKLVRVLFGPASSQKGTNGFNVPGDQRQYWLAGMNIYFESTSDTGYYTVVGATYSIIGNVTSVIINGVFTTGAETVTVYAASYYLTKQFYTANTFAMGYPDSDIYLHPYGYTQAYSIWNQYNRAYRIFNGSVKGITTTPADLIHKYLLTDANPNTDNRYFMLLSYSRDYKTGIWTAVVVEVYNTVTGKVYTDPLTFKYLQ